MILVIEDSGVTPIAIFDARNGWSGNLSFLRAGRGYMLKASNERRFTYPSIFHGNLRMRTEQPSREDEYHEEEVIPHAWAQMPETMNAIVQLPDSYHTVSVYDLNGQLKGQSITMEVAGQNPQLPYHLWRSKRASYFLRQQR